MGRRNPPRRNQSPTEKPSQLRIIGGEWRGRKIPFTPLPGLRPTPDRVRETLFNWLQPYLAGAHCLDLFSGSGALGFEALSRGAETVTFIDQEPSVVRQLRDNLQLLRCNRAEVIQDSVLSWLERRIADEEQRYDIIFMDPPFRKDLAAPCCELLEQRGMLAAEAVIYVETESDLTGSVVPANWQQHRQKEAGQVRYQLFIREALL
ncbi:16S rRNA (guanine(966)-N(2))-methyltransferase RsmD [Pontibacterium granulatum]|uniref:16S rRNA (guanine(966)-N(2))-methyltransferase RsmD n=1 Tax=Pontibacterium granulatum TaxID=2036029 RepID=UPI00249CAEBC|nr:16S rRNA (guanine(966)-N(2))-methyltransferase RsmD [Pontibacterium granulatum]MDI3324334.1 16S rRNA (guanine(966)-N(2))-methyltransferase RsmD [Pontibacterium granulatum]